jgi:hypothetical protein
MDKCARMLVRFTNPPAAAFLLAAALVAAAGCGADGDRSAGRDDTGGDDGVATVEQGLDVACSVAEAHGGDAFGNGYDKKLGCSCRPGFIHDSFVVQNTGQGSCNAIGAGWVPGNNLHDCSVNVHVQNAFGGGNGLCTVAVNERPDPCSHGTCSEGSALATTCSPAAARLCAVDGFCCTTQWDRQCVDEMATIAHSFVCTSPPCPHAECSTGAAMPSACSATVSQVCAIDPVCCNPNASWDSRCVSEVASVPGASCN